MTLKVLPSFEYSLTAQTWLISIGQAENLRCFKTHVQGACYAHYTFRFIKFSFPSLLWFEYGIQS